VNEESLSGTGAERESNWDRVKVEVAADSLLAEAADDVEIVAARDKMSGAWLHVSLISSVGLRMDDSCWRIAVGLRLGTFICVPHICQHCGAEVSARGLHVLSCRSSEGRHT